MDYSFKKSILANGENTCIKVYYINVSLSCPSTFSGLRQDFFFLRFGLKQFGLTLYFVNFSCFITSGLFCILQDKPFYFIIFRSKFPYFDILVCTLQLGVKIYDNRNSSKSHSCKNRR